MSPPPPTQSRPSAVVAHTRPLADRAMERINGGESEMPDDGGGEAEAGFNYMLDIEK